MSVTVAPFNYSDPGTPVGYNCGQCNATGVKLFREYNTFLDHQRLLCCACAEKDQEKKYDPEESRSCIGWLIAAVPTEEGDTYWGYTSVPEPGCDWWYNLPLEDECRKSESS